MEPLTPPPSALLTPGCRQHLRTVFDAYGVTRVRIVGSVARGTDKPGSDIDFLCEFPQGFTLFDLFDLRDDLEAILGVPVDLISDSPRPSRVLENLRRDAIPL